MSRQVGRCKVYLIIFLFLGGGKFGTLSKDPLDGLLPVDRSQLESKATLINT